MLSRDRSVLRVALPVPLPRLFDYLPPAGASIGPDWIGRRVRVPFGRTEQIGVVLSMGAPEASLESLKTVLAVLDDQPLLGPRAAGNPAFLRARVPRAAGRGDGHRPARGLARRPALA